MIEVEEPTLHEVLKGRLREGPIWDYRIYGPLSLDDEATVKIVVEYGREKAEHREEYLLRLGV